MVLANGVGGVKGVKAYFVLLILSLTVMGNGAELCSSFDNTGVKCSARSNALIAIGAISALLVIVALILRALGFAAFFGAELILLAVLGTFWVAAAAVVSSPKSKLTVLRVPAPLTTGADTVNAATILSMTPFFASWLSLMLVVVLLGDAVAKGGLPTLPPRPASPAAPPSPIKPGEVPRDADPSAVAEDAGGQSV
eukprot:TRINITY_DN84_c0_g1_i1.p2 TRINITY_DN84_c0_g1~~TRINITY_DN84_c0_g1_i1.p2  ORF type:complete len:196 (-),score=62.98 TRINITY_DN84_c0_g1_i1:198-785(-)